MSECNEPTRGDAGDKHDDQVGEDDRRGLRDEDDIKESNSQKCVNGSIDTWDLQRLTV